MRIYPALVLFFFSATSLAGSKPSGDIRSYPLHYYNGATGSTDAITVKGKEIFLGYSKASNQKALHDFMALRWQVLDPNHNGKIILQGILGKKIERKKGNDASKEMTEFILVHWYLAPPFERVDLKDENDPLEDLAGPSKVLKRRIQVSSATASQ